jgi:hypothetical protein
MAARRWVAKHLEIMNRCKAPGTVLGRGGNIRLFGPLNGATDHELSALLFLCPIQLSFTLAHNRCLGTSCAF